MKLTACLLLLLAVTGQAVAWDCPGGVKGADQVTGYSPFLGVKGEDKPLKYVDQVPAWKKYGAITKINLYFSWTHNCLQGFKVTYGYDARNAQLLGVEKGLTEKSITLAPYENINKVEIKQGNANKCIEWIKLYTNKTNSMSLGNSQSASAVEVYTVNRKAGFLAAIRGYEDYYAGQPVTKGGLQQLQFVWGVAVCPASPPPVAPVPKPSPKPSPKPVKPSPEPVVPSPEPVVPSPEPAEPSPEPVASPEPTPEPSPVPSPEPAESPAPTEGPDEESPSPSLEPTPSPSPEPEPLCPPVKEQCDTEATSGSTFCPVIAPNTANQCVGGCCASAGKCKKSFCSKVGLGAEVMAKDMFCWGTNSGFLHKFNKCKNLACKLAVPGCVGDPLSGACIGTVVALSEDVDEGAKQWVGYPCLQTIPGGLPLDALGRMDLNGAYTAKLWSICNCKASKKIPGYNSATCKGPVCELFKKPELPSLNFGLPSFNICDIANIIDVKPFIPDLGDLFQKPNFTLPQIDIKGHLDEIKSYLNGTVSELSAPLKDALSGAKMPTFSLNLTKPQLPTLSLNFPKPDLNLSGLMPHVDLSALKVDKQGLRVFNMSALQLPDVVTLENLLKAFDLHKEDDSNE